MPIFLSLMDLDCCMHVLLKDSSRFGTDVQKGYWQPLCSAYLKMPAHQCNELIPAGTNTLGNIQ